LKLHRPEAAIAVRYIKTQGLSYHWIEHRMGKPENWAKRVAENSALTTQTELQYLLALADVLQLLPKKRRQHYQHRAAGYSKNK